MLRFKTPTQHCDNFDKSDLSPIKISSNFF